MNDQRPDNRNLLQRLHIDPTISVGHILTTIMILISLISWGSTVESRLSVNTVELASLRKENERQDAEKREVAAQVREARNEIREDLRELKGEMRALLNSAEKRR